MIWPLLVVALFIACQKAGEPGFIEGRQAFRELLALRDQLSREFHETVADVSIAKNGRMTVKFLDSPLSSRAPAERQQRADAVLRFVLKNYKQPISTVAVVFASQGGKAETYVARAGEVP